MIGVLASAADLAVVREFFELFKTPWEATVQGRSYDAVIVANRSASEWDAPVLIVYDGSAGRCGDGAQHHGPVPLSWGDSTLPVYGPVAVFDAANGGSVLSADDGFVIRRRIAGAQVVWQVGYDLFAEVRHLLEAGQSVRHAHSASLDLHIDVLRSLLVESGVGFVEVPPHPAGIDFICCLTHDIDFVGLRRHGLLSRTLAGFIWRASFGTASDLLRGRRRLANAARNWRALLTLPFVFLGWSRDPWAPFEDYGGVEEPPTSTFFVVPFSDRPGIAPDGTIDGARAVRYRVEDIVSELRRARTAGSELGVHGIDAWRSTDAGRAEMSRITDPAGQSGAGVRMHWLYFTPDSPKILESAGFEYDSTCGFNEAVGFRAGTLQAFRPLNCEHLLELPLSIMDSALFSDGRLGVDDDEAARLCDQIIAAARRFGGALVINWHCRSLAPERLWGQFYSRLLADLRDGRVWFATAQTAVEWFRWRRSVRFERAVDDPLGIRVTAPRRNDHPGVLLVHHAGGGRGSFAQRVLDGGVPVELHVNKQPLILEAS